MNSLFLPKSFKILPKWQNFAESGHTVDGLDGLLASLHLND